MSPGNGRGTDWTFVFILRERGKKLKGKERRGGGGEVLHPQAKYELEADSRGQGGAIDVSLGVVVKLSVFRGVKEVGFEKIGGGNEKGRMLGSATIWGEDREKNGE